MNVHPALVAEKIRAMEEVRDCAVRPCVLNGETRLKAFIVPAVPDEKGLAEKIRIVLKRKLEPEECPVSVALGDALPRNEMGKLSDW